MRKKQLPQLHPLPPSPTPTTPSIPLFRTEPYILQRRWQILLGDKNLTTVLHITPLTERQQRHGIINMCDSAKRRILRRRSGRQVKSGIEVGGKRCIAKAWLTEGGDGEIVAQSLEF
jgi:hypothetical protein